ATNHLDAVLAPEPVSEGFIYRHGHPGLLDHPLPSCPTKSTTTKDTYRPPHKVQLLGRGKAQTPELGISPKSSKRKEMLEAMRRPWMPMESVSTTHRDYCARGFQFTPLPPTQPHDYLTEQPCSFWLERARSLRGVTSICSGNSPFRRNAAFSTPITEYLPCTPLSSQLQPHKQ
ncbi:SPAG8 protein, partial [Chordeiles acutipennis]|nr:SPAG8 protein [Chordeiles acutipennis]